MSTPLFAVLMIMLLGLSGLAMDGGQLFLARRDTQSLADAAARAGAAQLDQVAARINPDSPPQIDPIEATDAAETYIADARPERLGGGAGCGRQSHRSASDKPTRPGHIAATGWSRQFDSCPGSGRSRS